MSAVHCVKVSPDPKDTHNTHIVDVVSFIELIGRQSKDDESL